VHCSRMRVTGKHILGTLSSMSKEFFLAELWKVKLTPYTNPPTTTTITHPGNTQCICTKHPPPTGLIHTPKHQPQYSLPDKCTNRSTVLRHTQLYMATHIHQKTPTHHTAHYPRKDNTANIHVFSCCSKQPHMQ